MSTPAAPVVRAVREDELDDVGRLTVAVYVAGGFDEGDPSYRAVLRDAAARAVSAELLVAEVDGRLAGTVTFVPGPGPLADLVRGDDEAELRMLAVAPDARRRGVAEALVRACLDRAGAAGKAHLVISTQPTMTDAHRLYERLGFRRAPERDWAPHPDVPLLVYTRPLDGAVSAGGRGTARG